jgi:hypothetical protein
MANNALNIADLARMVRQVLDSEEMRAVKIQDPSFVYSAINHLWRHP